MVEGWYLSLVAFTYSSGQPAGVLCTMFIVIASDTLVVSTVEAIDREEDVGRKIMQCLGRIDG